MIEVDNEIKELFPQIKIGYIVSEVKIENSNSEIISKIDETVNNIEQNSTVEDIRENSIIKSTKNAYRKMGKDPNRYRPAAESLLRRVVQGKGLYHINNVVDILNLISIQTGFSICGYDFNKIDGNIILRRGNNEIYEGIGRGNLNITDLPVFSDGIGAFGTPTSDSTRTMIDNNSKKILFIFPLFDKIDNELEKALNLTKSYFEKHHISNNFKSAIL